MFLEKIKYHQFKEKLFLLKLLFFGFIPLTFYGQLKNNNIKIADSLFNEGVNEIRKGSYDYALNILKEGLIIYKDEKIDSLMASSYNQIATAYFYQSDFKNALFNFQQSRLHFQKTNKKRGVASTTNNIGAVYYYQGNYPRALEYYKKALLVHEELQNKKQIAGTTQNIGNIYLELKDYSNAKKHFEIAKDIYKENNNTDALALILSSIGKTYMEKKNYKQALNYFTSSTELINKNVDKQSYAEIIYNTAKLQEALGNLKKATSLFEQSITISRDAKSQLRESSALIASGKLDLELNRKKQALKKCKKGLKIAKKINTISIQEEACKCLYDAYKAINNPLKALYYNEHMYLLRDSLNLKQTSDKILNMQFEKEMLIDSIAHAEKERKAELAHQKIIQKKEKQRNIFVVAGCFALLLALGIFSRLSFVKKSRARLQIEKDRSEHLLHNILPEEVAEELKEKGYVDAQDFETASILFTDFKSFTETASHLTPQELVEEINVCFKAFDEIIEHYQIEKIKTIGDAYMAAGGLPKPDAHAVKKTILAGLDMQCFIAKRKRENTLRNKPAFEMRVGIHVGPIVAGIVGVKKFQYDIWGDTVNTASRMESNSEVGKVNISQNTYLLVKDEKDLVFEYRGKIATKGKGELEMYFVTKRVNNIDSMTTSQEKSFKIKTGERV